MNFYEQEKMDEATLEARHKGCEDCMICNSRQCCPECDGCPLCEE